jgi:hypothetical protein
MRRTALLACAFLTLALALMQTASAQWPTKIPKIPKADKSKPQPTPDAAPQPATSNDARPANDGASPSRPGGDSASRPARAAANAAQEDTAPSVAKDSVQINAVKVNSYRGSFDTWSWVPAIEYHVNGPVASGSQLSVEFSLPTGAWLKVDCPTEAVDGRHVLKTRCGGFDIRDDSKSATYTGPVNFAVKLHNELAGADATLYTGRFKVGRVHSNEVGPKAANRFVYYVDKDWSLPVGYVATIPDDVHGWDRPYINVLLWVRGEGLNLEPHLFYQGREVGLGNYDGKVVGGSCDRNTDMREWELTDLDNSVRYKYNWTPIRCTVGNVLLWDKTNSQPGVAGPPFLLASNPGEYELKILWNNHLARSIKFNVGPNGIVDNGVASSNKLGTRNTVIVPVQVIGDQDGQWDKAAWKTEAFYGNPLAGFSPPQ